MRGFGLLAAICSLLAACGGLSSAPAPTAPCHDYVAPCGGDIVGSWNVVSECVTGLDSSSNGDSGGGCTFVTQGVGSESSGSFTFNADGTYSGTVTLSVTRTTTTSVGCRNGVGAQSCDAFAQNQGLGTICRPTGAGCTCVEKVASASTSSGTYSTQGTTLLSTWKGGSAPIESPVSYCVSGNTLTITSTPPDASVTSPAAFLEVVLAR